MKKILLTLTAVIGLNGNSWSQNYADDPTLAFTNMGFIGDASYDGSGWKLNQDESYYTSTHNGAPMGEIIWDRILSNGVVQKIVFEGYDNNGGAPGVGGISLLTFSNGSLVNPIWNWESYPFATNLILNPGIYMSNYPGVYAQYLNNPPPLTPPTPEASGGAFIEQAKQLNINLTFQGGQWAPQ
jgi:hypothetical protein